MASCSASSVFVPEALAAVGSEARASDQAIPMPRYSIHTTNSVFESNDDHAIFDGPAEALASAVQGAIRITADEIASGNHCASIDICVDDEHGMPLLRSVVALSVAPLLTHKRPPNFG